MWWITDTGACWFAALRGLSRGFTYPDAGWVASLSDGTWTTALSEVLQPLGAADFGERIIRSVQELPRGTDEGLLALQVEYTYLFINAVPKVPAPPYASAYSGEGWLMGEPAESALKAYRTAGVALLGSYSDLPDHVATELEFASWLGLQARSAQEDGDDVRAHGFIAQLLSFWEDQLASWLPRFCSQVDESARLSLYAELARLSNHVVVFNPPFAPSSCQRSQSKIMEEQSNGYSTTH